MNSPTASLEQPAAATTPSPWAALCDELAPAPGRLNAVLRIVAATTIVLVTSMTLEVPFVGLSLFIVLFLNMARSSAPSQTSSATLAVTIVVVVLVTLSIGAVILVYRYTLGDPMIRLAAMTVLFMAGLWLSRVIVAGSAGFLVGAVILVLQAFADFMPGGPEGILRTVLWSWVAIVYPAVVTAAVNLVLLPADPEPVLRREAAGRLRAVARVLAAPPGSDEARHASASLSRASAAGPAPLIALVRLAESRDPSLATLRAERVAKIDSLERLVQQATIAADLAGGATDEEGERLAALSAVCARIAQQTERGARVEPAKLPAPLPHSTSASVLAQVLRSLERSVSELPLVEPPPQGKRAGLFLPDAFSNPRHFQFTIKVTLAALLCYVAYTAMDWPGIHTALVTCAFVALASTGATLHKATLRIVGCLIGGALALASIVFLIPHMTDIVPLALLVAAVSAVCGWIAMGSERSAYAGLQVAFAFYLAVLQGYAPSEDLTAVRDRLIGILFGILVLAVVFTYLWPERAGAGLGEALGKAMRNMARLAAGESEARLSRDSAWQSLRDAERLLALRAFEREARGVAGAREQARLAALVEATRQVLLAQSVLLDQRETSGLTPAGVSVRRDPGLARVLEHAADQVQVPGREAGGYSTPRPDVASGPKHTENRDLGEQAEEHVAELEPGIGLSRMLAERVATLRHLASRAAA